MAPPRRRHLGWLGPAIVLVGIAVAVLGAWLILKNKPKPGEVIETAQVDADTQIIVRAEDGGDRSFVELHHGGEMKWQALVPHYAGRPGMSGLAWSTIAVSVRVVRDGRAEVFALALHDASKLGGLHLSPEKGPVRPDPVGPMTLTDHVRSYEIVEGDGWNQITAIDLSTGKKLWMRDLVSRPPTDGGVESGKVWLTIDGQRHYLQAFDGVEDRSFETTGRVER